MKTKRERRTELIKDILMYIALAVFWIFFMLMFFHAWVDEEPITLHDHISGYEDRFAGTNWCTEK